ncbi:MAG: hypothetical protein WB495_06585, partial [Xanthobacteraceae bacterium]
MLAVLLVAPGWFVRTNVSFSAPIERYRACGGQFFSGSSLDLLFLADCKRVAPITEQKTRVDCLLARIGQA